MDKYCATCCKDTIHEWMGYAAGENLFRCTVCNTCRSDNSIAEQLKKYDSPVLVKKEG